MLGSSEGMLKDILESIDLQEKEIYTAAQLRDLLAEELALRGVSKKDIKKLLANPKGKIPWAPLMLLVLAGAGLFWFILAWWRRRKNGENQED